MISRHLLLSVLLLVGALGSVPLAAAAPGGVEVLDSGLRPPDVEQRRYREYVRECLDLLLAEGTDRYGPTATPLLVAILDVRTRTCPERPDALDEAWRVARRDRRAPAGNNLYFDQPALRALQALSAATGEPRYAAFAKEYMAYVLKELVDEQGLLWWGWHRHYDVYRDVQTGHSGNVHEIHIQETAWPELWAVDRAAVRREIEALWRWHVIDQATGEVNRHADGQRGCDFAMTGGEILQAFAFLFQKTQEPVWRERARLVADYYWRARHPASGLIPNRPNAGQGRFDGAHFDLSIAAFYCRGLLRAWQWTGAPAFREQAVAHLAAFAARGYDADTGRFWGSLKLDGTPEPGPRAAGGYAQYEPRGPVDLWQPYAAGYEHPLAAAQTYALACHAVRTAPAAPDDVLLTTAKRWAECVRREFPPRRCEQATWYRGYAEQWAPHGTYAEHYGRAISFLLQLHALTGDVQYREFAQQVAREAVSRLYYRGLLRGHPAKPYYEAADGVGYLLVALLQLDRVLAGADLEVEALCNF